MGLQVVILAAGKGKRMASEIPKVLHTLGGVTLLEHVVRTAQQLYPENIFVVYGNGGSKVHDQLSHLPVQWVEQTSQLGTGHAVQTALPFCKDDDTILVLYGDVPLISLNTLQNLLYDTPHKGLGLVVTELSDPTGFGRIIRNRLGNIIAIVEHKDASVDQLKITEINTGIINVPAIHLKNWLPRLTQNNKQQEYYLTDIVALAVADGYPVGGVFANCPEEVQGVNDRWQLATLERYYQHVQAKQLAYSGVTIRDLNRVYVRGQMDIDIDVVLDVNVILEGKIKIGKNTQIGPNVYLKDVEIGENVEILANSFIEGAKISNHASVGPFARIRPGTVMEENSKVGNFVEVKKTVLGKNSKASHLTYLGDAIIGDHVNIGAGTITCNYDGVQKWQTKIGDYVFVGSNTSLVAPVTIGDWATIGAGSTITDDAPAHQLSVARAKQCQVKGWKSPLQKKKEKQYSEDFTSSS